MSDHRTPLTELNRWRVNIQLGDGPDQRGDITIETVREPLPTEDVRKANIRLPDGLTAELEGSGDVIQGVRANDHDFAEFYLELLRGKAALIEALDLDMKPPEVTAEVDDE